MNCCNETVYTTVHIIPGTVFMCGIWTVIEDGDGYNLVLDGILRIYIYHERYRHSAGTKYNYGSVAKKQAPGTSVRSA